MKKKGILSLVLALVMVFSVLTPAFASGLSDVEGTEYETAVGRLAALKIMNGYEDGTFKVEKDITRAEFSTLVVNALGLATTAKASAGSTKFKDVKADHWASGYINLAASKGIISGYPDGTFKPEAKVTYAEALTMLVRTVGYGPAIETTDWPTNYITKAAEIGITGNVNFVHYDAAIRGKVAALLNNTLEVDLMEQVGYGDEKTWEEKEGKTLLTEYLNVHELEEAIVSQTSGYSQERLDSDEVEVKYDDKTYIFKLNNVNLDALLGHEVTLFVQDADNDNKLEDDEVVVYAESTTSEKDILAWDYVVGLGKDTEEGYDIKEGGMTVSLDAADDTFDLAKNAVVYYNYEKLSDLSTLAAEYKPLYEVAGKVIFNDDDEVIFMNLVNYDNPVVITEVKVDDEKVKYFNHSENESTLTLDGETYTIYKNGENVSIEELAANDVLYFWELTDGSYALEAYDGKITGTLEEVNADSNIYWDYSLVVDGKTIYVGPNFTISVDENDTVAKLGEISEDVDPDRLAELEDMVGTEVTVYLGKYQDSTDGWNYGRHIVNGIDTREETFFMVTEQPWSVKTSGTKYYIELVNMDDQEIVYELTEDATDFDGKELDLTKDRDLSTTNMEYIISILLEDTLVNVEFNNDGTISSIDPIDNLKGKSVQAINADYDRIKIDGTWYYVTEETALFDAINNEAIDWESLEDVTFALTVEAASADGKELEALIVSYTEPAGTTIGSSDYGLVLKRTVKSDGLYVTLAVEDTVGEFYAGDLGLTDRAALKEGTLVKFTASGNELDSITIQSSYLPDLTITDPTKITSSDFSTATITVTGEVYSVVKDVYGSSTNLYLDVDSNAKFTTGDIKAGEWNSTDTTFTAEGAYEVNFAFNKFEIVSGGVDTKNGVIEVVKKGQDEDVDPTLFFDVDQFGEDTFYYDIDSSHLKDPATKILKLSDLNDGYLISVYDVNGDGIYDYVILLDR